MRAKFGEELRGFRTHARFTQKQLARAANVSQSHVSSIEVGTRGTTEEQIAQFDEIVDARGSLVGRWRAIFRAGGLPAWFTDKADLQARANQIHEYQISLIPGLLQTPKYAEELLRFGRVVREGDHLRSVLDARMKRQEILKGEDPPWYVVVLDEPWLHRPVGGARVMRAQLEYLLVVSEWSRVTVQVIPMDTTTLAGIDGSFQLIWVPGQGEYVYSETRNRADFSTDPDQLRDYTRLFGELRGAALPEDGSRGLIRTIMKEYE
ncbi:helix-turn-helix domain-containing protein [Spiractinospora alimapuensis]|uniref:helix-turn-helix domain-containing protein n=1 Tax=Spiractinospora alimapuensis TaxID=2820884 RepID=UPI001F4125F2|nr:helix-turn-helix transcriptional regulator [Spiractinospora alimapuensis]QVQ53552.1 helix-turn-helix domain-containing protein [Spiractinospora alimapuensis]